jgi:hypothetical protein
MIINEGLKAVFSKKSNKSSSVIEITRHKDQDLDHILIVNSIGSKKFENSWIIEKDLPSWINYLSNIGYTEIKIVEDVESSRKNNKKKT